MTHVSGQSPSGQIIAAITRILRQRSVATLTTLVASSTNVVASSTNVGAKLLIEESGASAGSLSDAALDEAVASHAATFLDSRAEARTFNVEEFAPQLQAWRGARVLFERVEPEPRLVICGAGHVGASLARLACAVGYRTTLIDDRRDFVTRERFPDERIELVAAETWTDAVTRAIGRGRSVAVAVVTRGHNEDEECMLAVVGARPDYVGLIGSKRRTNIVLARLSAAGADVETLRAVRAPIGLDIGAVSPEEVALAILAEVVAARRGGTGAPLSAWRRTAE
ncbi:MAG: xanthine dehydrogenase accessory factor [Blastocatellia bacterium]|jgi:xanthine dehydrogenase accessory factor|nr:xanthine dehydrogenase accessory factor [Blastocatellia bacterium]